MTVDSSARAPIALARSPNVVAPAMVALPPIIESLEPQAGILILVPKLRLTIRPA